MLALLQFDSADLAVVERMLAEGRLRTLEELRRRGRWHRLESPGTVLAAATYPTLYSGLEVGEHGVYYPFQWSAPEQRVLPASAFEMSEAVWERLARAGRRSLVVDPYEARRPRVSAGVVVSGWQFENRVVLGGWSEPRGARSELTRRFGRAPAVDEVFGRPSARGLARLRERLVAAPRRVTDAILDLLRREQFDLVWACFPSAHLAGHQLWDLSQIPDHERDRARALGLETALEEVYEAVDAALGAIVAALPGDADLIAFSPLGMGGNVSRIDLLPDMLDAVLGGRDRAGRAGEPAAEGFLWRLRAAVPTGLRAGVARALPDEAALALTARLATRGVDWRRTRAFVLPGDHNGHIRLNVRGREREGIVDQGERDALLEEIAAGLLSFHDEGGGPSIERVERASELYPGPRADLLPDLIVRWARTPSTGLQGVRSAAFGFVARRGVGTGRSGNHADGAWALVVPGTSRVREPGRAPRVVDLAATIAAVVGGDVAGLAGEPLLEPASSL